MTQRNKLFTNNLAEFFLLQEEKLEDYSLPVNVPADPSEYGLEAVS